MIFKHIDIDSLKNVLRGYFPKIPSETFDKITNYGMGCLIEREALWTLLRGGNGLYPYEDKDCEHIYQVAVNRACKIQFNSIEPGEEKMTECAHKLFYVIPDVDELDISKMFPSVRETSKFGRAFQMYNDSEYGGHKHDIIKAFITKIGMKANTATTYYFIIRKRIAEMVESTKCTYNA